MKLLLLFTLIFSPLIFAERKPITIEQYQKLLIEHAVSMNSYQAGMSFLYQGGSVFVPIPGENREGATCKGNFQRVSTILLVGPSNDYFLLTEDKVTFDENQECRKYFENGRQVNAKIFLKKFKPLTVHELSSLKNNFWKGIYQLSEHKVLEIRSPNFFPVPIPGCPVGAYKPVPILDEFNGSPEPIFVEEVYIDLSRPRDFGIYKRVQFDGKEIHLLLRNTDANLAELNEKYKNLEVEKPIYSYPINNFCELILPETNVIWGDILKKGMENEAP